jgi:predicted nuclease of predicted toxin-antitoxin system
VRLLADMDVDVRVAEWLRAHGHDALHLREEGLQRAPDDRVFAKALDRIVLTFDLDFGDLAVLTREPSAHVILFRLENMRTRHVIERLEAVLAGSADALTRSAVVIVEEGRHRIRYLPIGGGGRLSNGP